MRTVSYVHADAPGAQMRIDMLTKHHFDVNAVSVDGPLPDGGVVFFDAGGLPPDDIRPTIRTLKQAGCPILVRFEMTRVGAFRTQRSALLEAGADDVVRSDASDGEFLTRLRAILLQQRSPRILVIEDEADIGTWVAEELQRAGMQTVWVTDLASGRKAFEDGPIDALIVDRQLPDGDGLSFVAELHAAGIRTPALIYSALDQISDRIEGLEVAGAVDYLCKPVHADELIVRVKIALRPIDTEETIVFGPLEIMRRDRIVRWRGDRIELRPKESEMLIYLAERFGLAITHRMLYFDVWEKVYMEEGSNPVAAAKHRLINKLKDFFKARNEPFPEFLSAEDDTYQFNVEPLLQLPHKAKQA
ncbi:MAG: response regulator transcription factor [Roseobacter sp.]